MNTPPDNRPVKIYRMNDCDWFVARSLEEAKESCLMEYDGEPDSVEDARELTDEEMNTLQFWLDEDNHHRGDLCHWKCHCGYQSTYPTKENRWNSKEWQHWHEESGTFVPMKNTSQISFVEELGKHLAEGRPIPGLFASTEH